MREARPRVIYPGHGPTVFDGVGKIREYEEHRAMRERQVLDALATGPQTIAELVAEIYADVPSELHPAAAVQLQALMVKLEREERVVRTGSGESARFEPAIERSCTRCGRPAMPRSRLCRRCSLDMLQERA
jgi:glyoxylase-like metal-dependent hydrolase (beta-lactamase superfamily II)